MTDNIMGSRGRAGNIATDAVVYRFVSDILYMNGVLVERVMSKLTIIQEMTQSSYFQLLAIGANGFEMFSDGPQWCAPRGSEE